MICTENFKISPNIDTKIISRNFLIAMYIYWCQMNWKLSRDFFFYCVQNQNNIDILSICRFSHRYFQPWLWKIHIFNYRIIKIPWKKLEIRNKILENVKYNTRNYYWQKISIFEFFVVSWKFFIWLPSFFLNSGYICHRIAELRFIFCKKFSVILYWYLLQGEMCAFFAHVFPLDYVSNGIPCISIHNLEIHTRS